jgi:drug/metabolite transporter (DMT)-like permease
VVDGVLPEKGAARDSGESEVISVGSTRWIACAPAVFVLIWATGYVVAKLGMPHAPPFKFLAMRFALSMACLLVFIAIWRPKWPTSRQQWIHLAVVGALMQAGYLGGVWAAVKAGIGAGLSALIVNLQPILTAVWIATMVQQGQGQGSGVTARQWRGLVLGLVGVVLVMSPKFGTGGEANVWNVGLCVFALLSMTAGALYQKRFVQPCDFRTASFVQLGAALVLMAPLAQIETEAISYNAGFLSAMLWSVVVLTLGGSTLLYVLIQRGAATEVTSLLYLVPPVTAFMAWLGFGEAITWHTVVGMAITAVGVAWVVRLPALRVEQGSKS